MICCLDLNPTSSLLIKLYSDLVIFTFIFTILWLVYILLVRIIVNKLRNLNMSQ